MPQKSILEEASKENPESRDSGVIKKNAVAALSDANAPGIAVFACGMSVI